MVKLFGGVRAVDNVSFCLDEGQILGLIGPNGAGKTTLLRLIMGLLKPNSGQIIYNGKVITGWSEHKRVEEGITGTFQQVRPFRNMSVFENVLLPAFAKAVKKGQINKAAEGRAKELLELVGLKDRASELASVLPHGDLKKLEIARALATEPKILLLDEPFAGVNMYEIDSLSKIIKGLVNQGISIIIVEHRLSELMKIVDRVIVLNFGKVIAYGSPIEVVKDKNVIEAYIGEEEIGSA
ncbi:MAG: ABC transporter ATP-binding protein [Candidatus Bathyarchaeia archaeon]